MEFPRRSSHPLGERPECRLTESGPGLAPWLKVQPLSPLDDARKMGTKQNVRGDVAFQHLSVQVFRNGGQGHEPQGRWIRVCQAAMRAEPERQAPPPFWKRQRREGDGISCSAGLEGALVCAIGEPPQQLVVLSGNCSRSSEVVLDATQLGQVRLQWRNGWPAQVGEALDLGNGRICENWRLEPGMLGSGGPAAHGSWEARPDGVWTARLCCPKNSRQFIRLWGAGSGTASRLRVAAAEMMAGSSWSSALTAGREERETTGAEGPAERGSSTSMLYRREKGLWQPASWSTSVLYRREGLWKPASSYSSLSMTPSNR
ncbi:uncharacterized protein [Nothobranchius furzeri]|uniref:uncharacterized protein n=1 Tax=Nothobranchius furzeri TaxID=105023 RepID=UPI003904A142